MSASFFILHMKWLLLSYWRKLYSRDYVNWYESKSGGTDLLGDVQLSPISVTQCVVFWVWQGPPANENKLRHRRAINFCRQHCNLPPRVLTKVCRLKMQPGSTAGSDMFLHNQLDAFYTFLKRSVEWCHPPRLLQVHLYPLVGVANARVN